MAQSHKFKTVTSKIKEDLLEESKAKSTNRATEQWTSCFNEYLKQKNKPDIHLIATEDLPQILCDFYPSLKKVRTSKPKLNPSFAPEANQDNTEEDEEYHNTTLKCIRAALNRFFKASRGIDIISNDKFIPANEIFKALQRKGKKEGRGETENKKPICDVDFQKLSDYFKKNMTEDPNPRNIQEIVLFNIIYYMGRRGHENLRYMTKDTFALAKDSNGRRYIHQVKKELDKNHKEDDFQPNNEARIYEVPGKFKTFFVTHRSTLYLD